MAGPPCRNWLRRWTCACAVSGACSERYGFVLDEDKYEVFFHQEQLVEPNGHYPHEGEPVRFRVRYAPKGPEAVNVETVHRA